MNITCVGDINFLYMFGVLIFSFVLNVLFATYTTCVVALKPASAATTGMIISFLNAAGIMACTSNYIYFIPLLIGSWCGSFIVVYYKKRGALKQIKKEENIGQLSSEVL